MNCPLRNTVGTIALNLTRVDPTENWIISESWCGSLETASVGKGSMVYIWQESVIILSQKHKLPGMAFSVLQSGSFFISLCSLSRHHPILCIKPDLPALAPPLYGMPCTQLYSQAGLQLSVNMSVPGGYRKNPICVCTCHPPGSTSISSREQ